LQKAAPAGNAAEQRGQGKLGPKPWATGRVYPSASGRARVGLGARVGAVRALAPAGNVGPSARSTPETRFSPRAGSG
jgi:hypothetical protein